MIHRIKLFIYQIFRFLKIKKRVMFFSYYGENYGGSPKYISEYILKNDIQLPIVWAFIKPDNFVFLKDNCILVKYHSIKYFYYLATSKIIITNYRMTTDFIKRKNQYYIQTWHSSLRLKQIEKDAENYLLPNYIQMAKRDSKQIDLVLTGSKKSKKIFQNSFWYKGEYLDCGTPQCDLFFSENQVIDDKVRRYFNLSGNVHIALYAPTFRKNHKLDAYNLDYKMLLQSLEKKFGGEWVLLIRLHPHLKYISQQMQYSEKIIHASNYDDVQELLYCTDFLVTDYSAIMFDYLVTKKPCLLYLPDLNDYIKNERALYFDIKSLPFLKCYDNQEIKKIIEEFKIETYLSKCESFITNDIQSYDSGFACEKVYKRILEEMANEEI